MVRYCLACVAGLCLAGPALAGSWADGLFDELSRDFGSVPRGPALTHPFRVANNTGGPVHISGVRVSCGCLTAQALKNDLKAGEETAIWATMDTRRFAGVKTVTIYVTFDQPRFEEVRLWVQANGRDDIAVSPDALAFGRVKRGSTPTAAVTVTLLGNGQYRVTEAATDSNFVQPAIKEVRRTDAEVSYEVTAKLREDTPAGHWYADVWLKTNNPAMPKVRLPLNVEVVAPLSASPSTAILGQVKAGTQAERQIIIRGAQPFRITAIKGTDEQLTVRDTSDESSPRHVLSVKVKADKPGEWTRTLRVITDLKEEGEMEIQAKVQIVP